MAALIVRQVQKKLGKNPILRGIDLDVADGEFVVLVGPSGCGKSTLLRTLAGLETPDAGTVTLGGRDVTHAAPRDRDVAMVFQSYALYPHLRVRDNLVFGLKLRGADAATQETRVREVSAMLGLGPLLERFPRELSGGQRQRVAMGRAIARRPQLFLFDEPLSNLDAALRAEVRVEIKKLHQSLAATIVYVTHDQVEAMTLADRLVVLRAGVVEQVGPPLEVYERPRTRFVATFLGSPAMNFVTPAGDALLAAVQAHGIEQGVKVLVGIRPHDVVPTTASDAHVSLRVEVVEPMGFETYAHGEVLGAPFVARLEGTHATRPGDVLPLRVRDGALRFFDAESELAL